MRSGVTVALTAALVAGLIAAGSSPGAAAPVAGGSGAAPSAAPVAPVTADVADDRLLVGLEPGTSEAQAADLAADVGATAESTPGDVLILDPPGDPRGDALRAASTEIASDPRVRYVEPNYRVSSSATANDTLYNLQYALQGDQTGSMNAQRAWDATTGSASVVVGVLDSGIDLTHPDLSGNLWSNPGGIGGSLVCGAGTHGFDTTPEVAGASDCTPQDDIGLCLINGVYTAYQSSHGSHVSGIIGAVGNNATGVSGVSQDVSLLSLRMLDGCGVGTVADAIEAIDWALAAKTAGVNLRALNASWGGPSNSTSLRDAITRAETAGVVFVTAAGNATVNVDTSPVYPCSYTNANLVCVAATDSSDAIGWFSNYGATSVDVAAPGLGIWSTVVTNTNGCTNGSQYCAFDGTSMAAPQVTGGAALVIASQPTLTASQVAAKLRTSVDPVPGLAGKVASGGRFDVALAVQNCPPAGPTGTRWSFQTLDGAGGLGGCLDSSVGTGGSVMMYGSQPHVWYHDSNSGDLRHGWWNGVAWGFETLDGAGGANGRINANVGADTAVTMYGGQPHVWYSDATNGNLRHAWWTGSAWGFETLDGAGGANGRINANVGTTNAVMLYGGQPHVWYPDASSGDLRHGWWNGSAWSFETLDGAGGANGRINSFVGTSPSVMLYGSQPHAWYHDATSGNLRHAWWNGVAWGFETLDGAGGTNGRINADVGEDSSVIMYGSQPHIWYADTEDEYLRHAWWNGVAWGFETLDGAGGANGRTDNGVGTNSSVLLYGGQPHVWYYDMFDGDLRHGWWTGSAWAFETLDGAGGANGRVDADVGSDTAVMLYGGQPHVWYYDADNAVLRHGWWS